MNVLPVHKPRFFIETALALLLFLILLFDLYLVVNVFFGVFTYAIIFSASFSSLFNSLIRRFNIKRKLAAFLYGLLLISIFAIPFIFIISALSDYVTHAEEWITDAKTNGVPPLPAWVSGIPFAGKKMTDFWQKLEADPTATFATYGPQIRTLLSRLISGGAGIGGSVLEFIAGIIVSAVLLANEQQLLRPVNQIMKSLAGENDGPSLINAAGRAVKGVAVGVMGTAFIEALFAWIGFTIAGVSFSFGLAALTFFLAVVQLGPLFVWLPLAIWMGANGQTGWAVFVGLYGLIVLTTIDNILKPILIGRSGKLPVLVLFIGVIGGMVTWGFTGMFKGAIILALLYTILRSWLGNRDAPDLATNPPGLQTQA